jgi:glucose-6-phosphate 1-dehydrogenase
MAAPATPDASLADALVFFGATGDLARKKIFPALQALVRRRQLDIPVIGVAKSHWGVDQLRERTRCSLEEQGGVDDAAFARLASLLHYVEGDYRESGTYRRLRAALGAAKRPLHYLAIPPSMFAVVADGLAQSGCARGARVVVEKPFGRDLASAQQLADMLGRHFDEGSIFRIDHFLGREPVQNILYTRFANGILEPLWNRDHVCRVEITLSETFGVEGRGRFYEETGAIRDVIQNHLLQVLACLAMDAPTGGGDAVRSEKARLLGAVRPLAGPDVVRGQFEGYRSERGVAPDSRVETFAAVRLFVDSWRWADVPFYIRSGKCLAATVDEVFVEFRRPPRASFGEDVQLSSNHLRLQLSPDVVIALGLRAKQPGAAMVGKDVELIATHQQGDSLLPYERLLGDALRGDPSLFARQDSIEAQWRIVEPILGDVTPLHSYPVGSWGPQEADRLIQGDSGWRNPHRPVPESSTVRG